MAAGGMRRREDLASFEPYSWEPSTEEIARSVGLRPSRIIRMDTNVSPYAPVRVMEELARKLPRLKVNQYPDTSYRELRELLADYAGWDHELIVPTNGADEGIDVISSAFLRAGLEAISPVPTYSYFRVSTELQGARFVPVERGEDFGFSAEQLLERYSKDTAVIWICDPNNPTGNRVEERTVRRLCEETEALVVVDEAYFEFSGRTSLGLLMDYPNVCVVRTLSKAFGLAGLRIGYVLCTEEVARELNKARPPNSLGAVNVAGALIALRNRSYVSKVVKEIVGERERLFGELSRIEGLKVFPSSANFLLIKLRSTEEAVAVKERLLRSGIVVRTFPGNPRLGDCIRVTVCSRRENERFLRSLRSALEELRQGSPYRAA
jgi:histidinol-phosphate aminotransferase